MATLNGVIANAIRLKRLERIREGRPHEVPPFEGHLNLTFTGSAGQGFGVFQVDGV